MQERIIDEHFYDLPSSPYKYLTIFVCQDDEENQFIKFNINITTFTEKQREEMHDLLRFFTQYKYDENVLGINEDCKEEVNKNGETIFTFTCNAPILTTVSSYYSRNKCLETEMQLHILNIFSIYQLTIENQLHVDVSFDTMSILLSESKYPFPRLIITPYAVLKGFFAKLEGKETYIHKTYSKLYGFFNPKLDAIQQTGIFGFFKRSVGWSNNVFGDVISVLETEQNAVEKIKNNSYFKTAEEQIEIPSFKIEDLKYLDRLGGGAFGEVFLVQTNECEAYALKQSDTDNIGYLFKEAFVMHDLNHKNIVKTAGFCESEDHILEKWKDGTKRSFMLMEVCKGDTLENYVLEFKEGYLPVDITKLIFGQIANAVLHIHEKRYIHRDLKPENILLYEKEPFPYVKVCDFGLVCGIDSILKGQAGTEITMDTRMLMDEKWTDRVDLYSLGCVLYFMIFKKYPATESKNLQEYYDKRCTGDYDYSLKEGMGEEYLPLIDLVKYLVSQEDEELKQGERRNNEIFWTRFKENELVQECLAIAENTIKVFTD